MQRDDDFEIVIADDGSGEETRTVIEQFRNEYPIPLKHVWQEDDGFQKCRILNKAIVASEGDYIVMSDGDCIPRADFLAHGGGRGFFRSGRGRGGRGCFGRGDFGRRRRGFGEKS